MKNCTVTITDEPIILMDHYQLRTGDTAQYPNFTEKDTLSYLAIGLCGEAGEAANKLKKFLRGDMPLDADLTEKLIYELGDCMWYIAQFAGALGFTLSEVANANIDKLAARKNAGTIQGNGDGVRA
jgi:NTP pyrophosphatase (non-canonical NTP hydrolase)